MWVGPFASDATHKKNGILIKHDDDDVIFGVINIARKVEEAHIHCMCLSSRNIITLVVVLRIALSVCGKMWFGGFLNFLYSITILSTSSVPILQRVKCERGNESKREKVQAFFRAIDSQTPYQRPMDTTSLPQSPWWWWWWRWCYCKFFHAMDSDLFSKDYSRC